MKTTEKKYTRAQVFEFNEYDWVFERFSGYGGLRNKNADSPEYDKWISNDEEHERACIKRSYEEDFKLISSFCDDVIWKERNNHIHSDNIHEFLNKKYFKNEK